MPRRVATAKKNAAKAVKGSNGSRSTSSCPSRRRGRNAAARNAVGNEQIDQQLVVQQPEVQEPVVQQPEPAVPDPVLFTSMADSIKLRRRGCTMGKSAAPQPALPVSSNVQGPRVVAEPTTNRKRNEQNSNASGNGSKKQRLPLSPEQIPAPEVEATRPQIPETSAASEGSSSSGISSKQETVPLESSQVASTGTGCAQAPGTSAAAENQQNAEMGPAEEMELSCCDEKNLRFHSPNLACDGKYDCKILQEAEYFMLTIGGELKQFCRNCFDGLPEDIDKTEVQQGTNILERFEEILECRKCNRRFHKMCTSHYERKSDNFECDTCRPPQLVKNVDGIPTSDIAKFISDNVNEDLRNLMGEEAQKFKISVRNVHSAGKLAKTEKLAPVHQLKTFQDVYKAGMKYTERTFLAFQRNGDTDVLFFVMYTQEYVMPDKKGYLILDYLDTVPHVTPLQSKGHLYQTMILSYWKFMTKHGFSRAHFWAKPPIKGDDYVFHIHPKDQMLLDQENLETWYRKMLVRAQEEGLVESFRTFEEEKVLKNIEVPIDFPVFSDSLWPLMFNWSSNDPVEKDFKKNLARYQEEHATDNFYINFNLPPAAPGTATPVVVPHMQKFGNRNQFINICGKKNWEFVSFRRAKYSSIGIINVLADYIEKSKK